jgi:hypothetical protein
MVWRILAAALGATLAATGLVQLLAPFVFYQVTPGVTATGPFNPHFVRDVGAAFLTAAVGVLAYAWRPQAARPALLMAAGFLTLHAGVHVFDAVCGARPLQDTWRDLGAHLIALASLGLALADPKPTRKEPAHAESHRHTPHRPLREDLGL